MKKILKSGESTPIKISISYETNNFNSFLLFRKIFGNLINGSINPLYEDHDSQFH